MQGAQQFITSLENGIGIVERDLTGLGQDEFLAHALEERVAYLMLKFLDLNRQRRLRQVHVLGGPCETAFMRDRPEIVKVVEVEISHIVLFKRTISQEQ